ncbi:MAG: hypothetical protein IIC93_03780 [Chloroflexi bacterium]|nr:hypothetical protein [Chloroflexota bacterium]
MRKATILALAIALLVVVACSSDDDVAPTQAAPEPTPNIPATVRAQVQGTITALEVAEPEATAEPTLDRAELIAFANLHAGIETRWEAFHGDVDAWRQGLVACDLTIRNQAVSVFSSRFAAVTERTRGLPREELVRSVADQIIEAAEREAAALRGLAEAAGTNATVTLGDGSSVSAKEFVEIERAAAAGIRLAGEATLADLLSGASDDSRAAVSAFASDVSDIDAGWDQFITDYEAFRTSQSGLDANGVADALNALVSQFLDVSASTQALSSAAPTDEVAAQLASAARDTELALRTLRDAAVDESGTPDFVAFETQLVTGNGDRSAAAALLSPIVTGASADTGLIAAAFNNAYQAVATSWDRFHQDYDAWRASNGGCDVSGAVDRLGEFVVNFGGIATDARSVPRATAFRTLGELLIEAAEREAQAIAGLRAAWQPFEATVYEQFDLSRNAANKLRRQVSSGLEELLAQNGVSQADLTP